MRLWAGFAVGALAGVAAARLPEMARRLHAASAARGELLHTERAFELVAKASMDAVAPLLGADRERLWAPGWNPRFVWPARAADREGMVFTVLHGAGTAVWVNTCFDPRQGRVQYAYVVPDAMVTRITVQLTARGEWTHVAVEYERTALRAGANEQVRALAEQDGRAGPEWEEQINGYLEKLRP